MSVRPAVLFARSDSIYKTMDCDVWDAERDALKWPGGQPVVAHPPCGPWSSLRMTCKMPATVKALAVWAVAQVRQFGGVLEHPVLSTLFKELSLPNNVEPDSFGGWTYIAPQKWWGHKAEKLTRFYIVGIKPSQLPDVPFDLKQASHVVTTNHRHWKLSGKKCPRPELNQVDREATPPDLAKWLLETARRCGAQMASESELVG